MQSQILSNHPVVTLDKCYSSKPFDPAVDVDRTPYGSHFVSKSMMFVDANGMPFEVTFRNNEAFEDYIGGPYATNEPCQMCGRLYYDLPLLGVPISMADRVVDGSNRLVINMEGVFHSFECTYLALSKVQDTNPVYHQSEHILNSLFTLCYPDEVPLCQSVERTVSSYHTCPPRLPNIVLMPLKTSDVVKKQVLY